MPLPEPFDYLVPEDMDVVEGDVVVADACARLPFAASHTVNRLTHVEALWDVSLQRQVIALLSDRYLLAAA